MKNIGANRLMCEALLFDLDGVLVDSTDGLREVPGATALVKTLPPKRWTMVMSGVRGVEGYRAAAARLRVAPADCVVIQDNPASIAEAHAAGMRVIGITVSHPPSEFHEADAVVKTLDALTIRVSETRQAQPVELWMERIS